MSILCLLAACASRPAEHAGADVRILAQNRVAQCKKLKTATIKVQTVVGIWHLYPADVKADLTKRARKKASAVGADTASPLTQPNNGKQTFGLYKCTGVKAKKHKAETQTMPYHPPS